MRRIRVAIIGAGFGGMATAVKLLQRTNADFVLFEQAEELGDTWQGNRYPGCEVDIPSHAYSFSFVRYDWPRTHATQPELLRYAHYVAERFGLNARLRLGTRVESAEWDDERSAYRVRTDRGDDDWFDVVVSAVGLLSVPRLPNWPGLDAFAGPVFHTSRWEHHHDLAGKRVAVVGTGSTAAQVVPALAGTVAELLVFQREPGWVEPKNERAYSPRERWMYRNIPLAYRLHRAWIFAQAGRRFRANDVRSRLQRKMRERCVAFIESAITDPQLRRDVTPDYPWGCKRPIVASTFYSALARDDVRLVPHAVDRVTSDSVVDGTGRAHQVDVLILSTGFQPTRFLAGLRVIGRGGADLHRRWAERAAAFLGITVPDFPNFFVLYGPNTNGGTSIIAQLERQAEVVAASVRRLERTTAREVDTDPRAVTRWLAWVDRQLATHASAMNAGCHNYYIAEGGANVTQWPRTHLIYLVITRLLRDRGLRYR